MRIDVALSIGPGLGVPSQLDKAIAPHRYADKYQFPDGMINVQSVQMLLPLIFIVYFKPPSLGQEDNVNNTLLLMRKTAFSLCCLPMLWEACCKGMKIIGILPIYAVGDQLFVGIKFALQFFMSNFAMAKNASA